MIGSTIRPIAKNSSKPVVGLSKALSTREWGQSKGEEKTSCDSSPVSKEAVATAEVARNTAKPMDIQERPAAIAKDKKKTLAELDEELRLKLEGISGEGGTAGIEYEGGKAVGLKRGVKENMFRVI